MKRWILLSLAMLTFASTACALRGESPVQTSPGTPLKPFMQRKLDSAKGILEGLALEDYEQIAKQAQSLSLLSLESEWNVMTTEEYLAQSSDFRRAASSIAKAAREKDVNRAALGYVNLTVRCVECHNYLRRTKLGISEEARPQKPRRP